MRALRIPVDGPCVLDNTKITLDYLKGCVGGYIEYVRTDIDGALIVCDEEGALKTKPLNIRATALCNAYTPIVGDVVLVGAADEDGNETPVPESVVIHARRVGWLP
jgi:hypothetical protein